MGVKNGELVNLRTFLCHRILDLDLEMRRPLIKRRHQVRAPPPRQPFSLETRFHHHEASMSLSHVLNKVPTRRHKHHRYLHKLSKIIKQMRHYIN